MKTIAAIHTIIINCLNKAIAPEEAIEMIRRILSM